MLNKNDITNFAKRILHPHKGLRSPQIMHPTREWFVGLAIANGIFLASIAWSAYTYVSHQSVSIDAESVTADQPVVYRESMVKTALQIFADKKQLITEIIPEEPVPPTAGTSTPEVENLEVSQSTSTVEEFEAESDESTSSTTEPVTPEPVEETSSETEPEFSG